MYSPDSGFTVKRLSGLRAPWTAAGQPDPDYEDGARIAHVVLLTDALLLSGFRGRFPEHRDVGYDEMVRVLGYVWDCPHDGTANVTGHCCACCHWTRAEATAVGPRVAGGRR